MGKRICAPSVRPSAGGPPIYNQEDPLEGAPGCISVVGRLLHWAQIGTLPVQCSIDRVTNAECTWYLRTGRSSRSCQHNRKSGPKLTEPSVPPSNLYLITRKVQYCQPDHWIGWITTCSMRPIGCTRRVGNTRCCNMHLRRGDWAAPSCRRYRICQRHHSGFSGRPNRLQKTVRSSKQFSCKRTNLSSQLVDLARSEVKRTLSCSVH